MQRELTMTGAIFDCDGTLLDSLNAWRGLENLLSETVRTQATAEERAKFATFTIPEVAQYFHEVYGLGASAADVIRMIDDYMMDYYAHRAKALPGVLPFLEACSSADVKMCVASSSAQKYLQAGLKCAGIDQYFLHVFSVDDVDASKREPLIFFKAQEVLGTDRATTWGIDDSAYALVTLRDAGFPTIGIYNKAFGVKRESIAPVCDVVVAQLDELASSIVNR